MNAREHLISKGTDLKPPQARILGIGGSPRKGGNSDTLLRSMIDGARKHKVETHGIHLRDVSFQGCVGCEKCRKDKICTGLTDGMSFLYPDILESRGLILVSPTHNYNITAWMKAFIDRLYCFYNFNRECPRGWSSRLAGQGRKAVIGAICEQVDERDMGFTVDAMRLPLEALGYEVIGVLPVFRVFEKGKVKEDGEALIRAEQLGSNLADALLR
ncbi:Multimeric flavodoxin WrbA [Desulfomicrobium apsheronum]|uniref:Multimeric flavodoxin WrbA n=1 Tax=Desulfomicrobium apsheronum TaxID=52560 RepID=A0A1I3XPT0_9BACT|nr:flavodoxin family protein [Desulfomicrobium apsheronum]SFK21574.1 Multimeric flavodoxin WrbA [Desulfomicrobium apsheronum]